MANQINLMPDVLDLILYAGDGVEFRVLCTDGNGAPIDMTGIVSAEIRLQRLDPDPPIVEFTVNMVDAYEGRVTLTLTGQQTMELSTHPSSKKGKFTGEWDMQWTPDGSEPRTMCQGKVECSSDVTR
jgi:hypothetical protein